MKLNFTVTDWVENQRFACRMTSGNLVKAYEQKLALEAIPSGSRFTFAENVKNALWRYRQHNRLPRKSSHRLM